MKSNTQEQWVDKWFKEPVIGVSFVHSFHRLLYDRSTASCNPRWSTIQCFLFQFTLSSRFLNIIKQLLTSSCSSSRHFYLSFNNVFRKQFLHKMWPVQLAVLLFTVCTMFLPSLTLRDTLLHFSHDRTNCPPSFSSTTFRKVSGISWCLVGLWRTKGRKYKKYVLWDSVIVSALSQVRHVVHRSSSDLCLAVGKVQNYMTAAAVMCCVACPCLTPGQLPFHQPSTTNCLLCSFLCTQIPLFWLATGDTWRWEGLVAVISFPTADLHLCLLLSHLLVVYTPNVVTFIARDACSVTLRVNCSCCARDRHTVCGRSYCVELRA